MPSVAKGQANEFETAHTSYVDAISEFTGALSEFNLTIQEEWDNEVAPKLEKLNESIVDLKTIAEEIRDELQAYYDERSEGWQAGDKGIAYDEWIDRWSNITYMDEIEIACPQVSEEDIEEEPIEAETTLEY